MQRILIQRFFGPKNLMQRILIQRIMQRITNIKHYFRKNEILTGNTVWELSLL